MGKITRDNVEKIRIFNKLSVVRMADTMGISRAKYNNFKNHNRSLKEEELAKLRVSLGVDLNQLIISNYEFSMTEKELLTNKELQLFRDSIDYSIDSNQIVELILNKIFTRYFSEKSFYKKLLQNNRAIVDFAKMLHEFKINKGEKISKEKSKDLLIKKLKNFKIDTSENRVKKNILNKIELLSEKDCYYILTFNQLAAKVLLQFISKTDQGFIKIIGYKGLLAKLGY